MNTPWKTEKYIWELFCKYLKKDSLSVQVKYENTRSGKEQYETFCAGFLAGVDK